MRPDEPGRDQAACHKDTRYDEKDEDPTKFGEHEKA
jgi:hypothetical protein